MRSTVRGALRSILLLLPACDLAFRLDPVGTADDAARQPDAAPPTDATRPPGLALITHAEGSAIGRTTLDVPLPAAAVAGDTLVVVVGAYQCQVTGASLRDGSNPLATRAVDNAPGGATYNALAGAVVQATAAPIVQVTAALAPMDPRCELAVEVLLFQGLQDPLRLNQAPPTTTASALFAQGIAPAPAGPGPAAYVATLLAGVNGLPQVDAPYAMVGVPTTNLANVPTAVALTIGEAPPPTTTFTLPTTGAATVVIMALQ
jgi:hypothetical protein